MGRFDNVNPSALKSGAEKCISDLNDKDFNSWYTEFQSTKEWRDYHKSAIETLLQYIGDYYESMREALDVLPPMADLIQQYKDLEKELEELKREYASAETPEERESIAYQIEAVQDTMDSILSEIEDLSNTTVTTSFSVDLDAYLYDSEPLVINTDYINDAHRNFDKIVYNLTNLHHYFTGNTELGGARNNYVANITHQIGSIFINMLEVLKKGQDRWKVFDQALEEAKHSLERYITEYSVDTFGSKTNNYTDVTIKPDDTQFDTNHKEKDNWREGTINSEDQVFESNAQQKFEDEGIKTVNSNVDSLNANVDDTPSFEQSQASNVDSSTMNSNYTSNELEKTGETTIDNVALNSQLEDNKLDFDKSTKVDTDGSKIGAQIDDIELPAEKEAMKTEDNRIHIDDFEATAEERLNEARLNIEDQKTTAEYESGYDF